MAYRLKSIQYKNEGYRILLQNENGPCPLLAAANVLLLKKSITLPKKCVVSGVVTIEELTNILAEKILLSNHDGDGSDFHINEVMKIFPNLQFGMDVNPKFTKGPTGVEYTIELNAFDLLKIELVHGWLLEPDAQEFEWVGENTYNQLVNLVIEGNDASASLQQKPDADDCKIDELSMQATRGTIIRNFLDRSAHQLTQHGLFVLHEYVKEGDMVVFFRNNHYNALTKHNENLYLLVTDFGYADVNDVIWEKLDVIDGDTEYVTGEFKVPPPITKYQASAVATGEQIVANNAQSQADYHLALQLSRESGKTGLAGAAASAAKNKVADRQQSELERAQQASLLEYQREQTGTTASLPSSTQGDGNFPTIAAGVPSAMGSQEERDMMLALELQRQERMQQREISNRNRAQRRPKAAAKDSCIIS